MATKTVSIDSVTSFLNDVADLSWLDERVFSAIGDELLISTKERFENEESPTGQKWRDVSSQHKSFKRKRDYGDKILGMRGTLKNTLRFQATDTSLQIGSDRKYAALHQFGGRFKAFGKHSATMPARPFLGLSDDDRTAIREELDAAWQAYLAGEL